jgi:hypothetical protein
METILLYGVLPFVVSAAVSFLLTFVLPRYLRNRHNVKLRGAL